MSDQEKYSLKATLQYNRMSVPTFTLLHLLERLNIKSVVYTHADDVREFVQQRALIKVRRDEEEKQKRELLEKIYGPR